MLAIRTPGKDASTWEPAFAADAGPRYVQFHAVRPDPLNRIAIDEAISPAFPLISTRYSAPNPPTAYPVEALPSESRKNRIVSVPFTGGGGGATVPLPEPVEGGT